jgi:hypothetical protein
MTAQVRLAGMSATQQEYLAHFFGARTQQTSSQSRRTASLNGSDQWTLRCHL